MTQKNNESENLSRIKEILFGEDLQSIDEQFASYKIENKNAFEQLKSELENRLTRIEDLLIKKNQAVEKVQEKTQEVQKVINQDFKKDISKVSLDVIKEKVRIEKVLTKNEDDFSEKISKLEKQLKGMIEKMMEASISKFDELNTSKLNKEVLAEIFSKLSEDIKK